MWGTFETLKQRLTSSTLVAYPKIDCEFTLTTDAPEAAISSRYRMVRRRWWLTEANSWINPRGRTLPLNEKPWLLWLQQWESFIHTYFDSTSGLSRTTSPFHDTSSRRANSRCCLNMWLPVGQRSSLPSPCSDAFSLVHSSTCFLTNSSLKAIDHMAATWCRCPPEMWLVPYAQVSQSSSTYCHLESYHTRGQEKWSHPTTSWDLVGTLQVWSHPHATPVYRWVYIDVVCWWKEYGYSIHSES